MAKARARGNRARYSLCWRRAWLLPMYRAFAVVVFAFAHRDEEPTRARHFGAQYET